MRDDQQRAVLTAAGLVQICRDCASALRTAADVAELSEARDWYRARAATWGRFCRALETAVREFGGAPPMHPGATGILQRAWIKIKSASGDADAIAAECAKREAEALRRCTELTRDDLPPSVQAIVDRFCGQLSA